MDKRYQEKIDAFITQATRKKPLCIPVRMEYIGFTGNIKNAVFLTQLIYWAGIAKRPDGGVYKTNKELQEQLGLSKREVENARAKLEEMEILTVIPRRANGHFTNHYYIDFETLETKFKEYLSIEDCADVLDAEIVEETVEALLETDVRRKDYDSSVGNEREAKRPQKTPMPKNFIPSENTMDALRSEGYRQSLLERYLKDCRHYYTVKNQHHRYADWDAVFKMWCSKNPKTDANSERLERLQELARESATSRAGTTDMKELARRVRAIRLNEANEYGEGYEW